MAERRLSIGVSAPTAVPLPRAAPLASAGPAPPTNCRPSCGDSPPAPTNQAVSVRRARTGSRAISSNEMIGQPKRRLASAAHICANTYRAYAGGVARASSSGPRCPGSIPRASALSPRAARGDVPPSVPSAPRRSSAAGRLRASSIINPKLVSYCRARTTGRPNRGPSNIVASLDPSTGLPPSLSSDHHSNRPRNISRAGPSGPCSPLLPSRLSAEVGP